MNDQGPGVAPAAPVSTLEALREVVAAGGRVSHVVARRAGLGDSELRVLQHLLTGPVGPAELARRLEVTTAAATGIVDRLEARGHVRRQPHAQDRRRTDVRVTDSGRTELLAHLRPMLEGLAALDAAFTEAERVVVERYLRGAAATFEALATAEDPPGQDGLGRG